MRDWLCEKLGFFRGVLRDVRRNIWQRIRDFVSNVGQSTFGVHVRGGFFISRKKDGLLFWRWEFLSRKLHKHLITIFLQVVFSATRTIH